MAQHSEHSQDLTHLIDILAGLGRSLYVGHAPLLCPALALGQGHLPLVVQITFVAHQQERYALVVLHPQDLFPVVGVSCGQSVSRGI